MSRPAHLFFVLAGLVLLTASIVFGPDWQVKRLPTGRELLQPVRIEGVAPEFSLNDVQGREVSLSGMKKQFVLLNFWATWCEPCIGEIPHLARLASRVGDLPLTLVLVSVDEETARVTSVADVFEDEARKRAENAIPELKYAAELIRGRPANVESILDPTEKTAHLFGTSKYPETYLIAPGGRLVAKFIGPKEWGRPRVIEFIRRMISVK